MSKILSAAKKTAQTIIHGAAMQHSVTLIPGDLAHNAAIVARWESAVVVADEASHSFLENGGELSSMAHVNFSDWRDTIRAGAASLKVRAAA